MRWDVSYTFTKLAVNNFQRWSKWTWFNRIDPVVILGALPDPRIIKILRDQEQLGGVINMCAEHPGEAQLCRSLNVPYLRLKTRDYTVPEFETIVNGVQWIEKLADQHLTAKLVPTADQQKPLPQPLSVYIHCKAGRGRSATIALCWLLYRYELTPEEAQALLLTKRPQVDRTLAAHPNVVRFYDEYCSPSTTSTSKPAPKRRPWVEAILVPSAPTPANPSDRVLVV
ncbi:protein-tyrosine phosphatase-like protein [Powellomyces hirtus]|nr:protein-tyrosine phosphatase-like protein [Powellomyces hirtus]